MSGYKNKKEISVLISNMFSLSVLQIVNYILPLITLPYLLTVLGPDKVGLISFTLALNSYFILFTDYGFNLSATKQISLNRGDTKKVNKIFSSVLMIKIILSFICLILLIIACTFIDSVNANMDLYIITFGLVIGQVINPIWLYQGLEDMKYITYINVIFKGIFTVLVFFVVNSESDYIYSALLTSLSSLVTGIFLFIIALCKFKIVFIKPKKRDILFQLKDGWHVFISTLSINIYSSSTTIILGIMTNTVAVGYFTAADRIIKAVVSLYVPVSQAIYPFLSKRISNDKENSLIFLNKLINISSLLMIVIGLTLFLFSEKIMLLFGGQYFNSILLLKIMSLIPFFVVISNIFGVQILLNFGYKKEFSRIVLFSALFGSLTSLILIYLYGEVGASISLLLVELTVTSLMGYKVHKIFKRI